MTVTPAAILRTMRDWLRAGYPEGVPQHDYVALLAVFRHNLTDAGAHPNRAIDA